MLSYERRRYLQQGNTQGDRVPLLIELQQLEEEGKDVSGLSEEVKKIWDISDILEREQACENFLKKTYDLPVRSDFPYIEPNSLAEIQKEWGNVPKSYGEDLSQQSYLEKVYGAVLGLSLIHIFSPIFRGFLIKFYHAVDNTRIFAILWNKSKCFSDDFQRIFFNKGQADAAG